MERQRPANLGRTREAWRILVDVGSIKHHTSGQGRRQRNAVDLNLRVRSIERRGEVTGRAHARLEFDTINRLVGDVRTKGRVGWRIRSRLRHYTCHVKELQRVLILGVERREVKQPQRLPRPEGQTTEERRVGKEGSRR